MNCEQYKEIAAAHADSVLAASESTDAETHVRQCPGCASQLQLQKVVAGRVRRLPAIQSPELMRRRIARQTSVPMPAEKPHRMRRIVAGTVAAGLVLATAFWFADRPPAIIATLTADVEAADRQDLPIDLETGDPGALRTYYAAAGVPFENSVEDLAPQGLDLVGGGMSSIEGRATTRTVYRTADDQRVVCRRFRAGEVDWPSGGQALGDSELFTRDGVNIALTRVGDVVCAMASRLPRDRFLHSIHLAHR